MRFRMPNSPQDEYLQGFRDGLEAAGKDSLEGIDYDSMSSLSDNYLMKLDLSCGRYPESEGYGGLE